MRKFDHNGLLLAEYQGKLFERSTDLGCSTGIFMRRFLHSDLLKKLDANNPATLSLSVQDGLQSIQDQFGDTNYGKVKYSKSAMFWIGYMYRYISYTREHSTKFVMILFSYKQMNDVYYTYHTQDPEWCVRSLLELNQLSESIFDKNARLKNVIMESGYYQTCLPNLNKQVCEPESKYATDCAGKAENTRRKASGKKQKETS